MMSEISSVKEEHETKKHKNDYSKEKKKPVPYSIKCKHFFFMYFKISIIYLYTNQVLLQYRLVLCAVFETDTKIYVDDKFLSK